MERRILTIGVIGLINDSLLNIGDPSTGKNAPLKNSIGMLT